MNNARSLIRNNRSFLIFMLTFGLIRAAIADYNPVPSGSMHPTILEGDVVLVDRTAYNLRLPFTNTVIARLGEPHRGDIATFKSPKDGVQLIKRVVGLPGDTIAMRDKRLLINGEPIHYDALAITGEVVGHNRELEALQLTEYFGEQRHSIQWLAGVSGIDNFGPLKIPADHYLMLGDNRDNSADSRYIGLVSRNLLIGRADRILVSAAITKNWMPRFERFGESLYETNTSL
jgi:signal peptidase I